MTPPIPMTSDAKNLESVIDNALAVKIRRLPPARNMVKTILGLSAAAGIATLVLETERQRQQIAELKSSQQAAVSFIKALVDETECGSEAYLYLQMTDEDEDDEDTITEWTEDDQLPIPFEITEDGWNYETEETNDGH